MYTIAELILYTISVSVCRGQHCTTAASKAPPRSLKPVCSSQHQHTAQAFLPLPRSLAAYSVCYTFFFTMHLSIWIRVYMLIVIMNGMNSEDLCVGTGCTCSEYPVRIECHSGRPDLIKKLVKRVAVSLQVNGDTIQDLLVVDLQDYVSLKTMDVRVYKKDACLWANDKQHEYTEIRITVPDFCKDIVDNINHNMNTATTSESTHTDDGHATYIVINVNDLILGFILLSCLSLCGVFRPYIRYVTFKYFIVIRQKRLPIDRIL